MNKDTIKLNCRENHISGYGFINNPYGRDTQIVLDEIVKWSQLPDNQGKTVYKHKIRQEEENHSKIKFYQFGLIKIPYCDLITYLDIYWQ